LQVHDIPSDLFVPNAFSPNGDGRNDIFRVITDNPNIRINAFRVFNRWGQQLYWGNRIGAGWDGRHNGRQADPGVYFWYLSYRVEGSSKQYEFKGDVTLVR
jgi:gliding motility-associated-like protein